MLISFGDDLEGYEVFGYPNDVKVAIENCDLQEQLIKIWCTANNIDARITAKASGFHLYRIEDESHRVWFKLKWGSDIVTRHEDD